MNIVDLVKNQLGGDLTDRIGGMLGVGGGEARTAVNAGIPAILAGLTGLAGTPDGARKLDSALDGVDDRILGNLGASLTGGNVNTLSTSGSNTLGSLLGGNVLGSLGSTLSRFTGLPATAINSLLGLLVPVVLGVLKGQRSKLGLDASGLANMLLGQKNNIAGALPSGLGSMLSSVPGFSALTGAGDAVRSAAGSVQRTAAGATRATTAAGREAVSAGSSAAKWAIPLVAVLALIALVWWMANRNPVVTPPSAGAGSGANTPRNTAPAPRASTTPPPADRPTTPPSTPPAVSGDSGVTESGMSVSQQVTRLTGDLSTWFSDATTSLSKITDVDSARAAIPGLESMADKLEGVGGAIGTLPAEARGTLSTLIGEKWTALQGVISNVMNIPGVADVLQPVMDRLRGGITALQP